MADVRLENLTAVFGTHRVFEGFSLTIRDGECFTLLGPSGCGKTVVGRMIAGFEHPSAGEIYIGDQLVSSASEGVHIPTELRGIGVVFRTMPCGPTRRCIRTSPIHLRFSASPERKRRRAVERA